MPVELSALLKQTSARHSHLCPRQVLGVRMGLAGLTTIGLEAPMPGKAALVITETDGCFVDGIKIATGATIGHRTLRVVDLGKIAATFADVKTGRSIRLAPRLDVRQRALVYAPKETRQYYAQLKAYQIMPETELFTFQEVVLEPSLESIISRKTARAKCAHCGEEIINGREIFLNGVTLCQTCGGESYYFQKQRFDIIKPDTAYFSGAEMDKLTWELLDEVNGRLEAELIESYLEAEGVDVELIQESIGHSSLPVTIARTGRVQIFVPKEKVAEAKNWMKAYRQGTNEEK